MVDDTLGQPAGQVRSTGESRESQSTGSGALRGDVMRGAMYRFFEEERSEAGWRFWVLWVAATNAGFFPGMAFGEWLAVDLAEPLSSVVIAGCFGLLVGAGQWAVLQRHLQPSHFWATGTALGWAVGAGVGSLLLTGWFPAVPQGGVVWVVVIGFIGGAVVGVPQYFVLRSFERGLAAWWVPISAIAWGVFFPGAVSGAFLARRLRRQ